MEYSIKTHIVDVVTVQEEEVHGSIDRHGGKHRGHPLQGIDLLHIARQTVAPTDELIHLPSSLFLQEVHVLVIHVDVPAHRQEGMI